MSFHDADIADTVARQPRAEGEIRLTAKPSATGTSLDRFSTSGSSKVLFPRSTGPLEGLMINTSGGLTGGDRFRADFTARPGSHLTLTTQAAERAYRAAQDVATVTTRLQVGEGARINWLPQELILFDRAALTRRLSIMLAPDARVLMVEPVVFGRHAMGERLTRLDFDDRVEIRRDGVPIYLDRIHLTGSGEPTLSRPATCGTARALATVVLVAPDAAQKIAAVRAALPETGGATLLAADVLLVRLLAVDGFLLRRSLIPILETLRGASLPRSWSL